MIDLASNMKIAACSDMGCSASPRSSATDKARGRQLQLQLPAPVFVEDPMTVNPAAAAAYEQYLRLPELAKLWTDDELDRSWAPGRILRPALQGLEVSFRLISVVMSDMRTYTNAAEWTRRLESLALRQVELVAAVCGAEDAGVGAPVMDLVGASTVGVLSRGRSSSEVWTAVGDASPVVSRVSEGSLLPRLAAWRKSAGVAARIGLAVECCMGGSAFTLGVGEPNLGRKPSLDYDRLCKPSHLHAIKRAAPVDPKNLENDTLFAAHQILECWVAAGRELLRRAETGLEKHDYKQTSGDCWLLERFWKLFSEIEDLHLLMDPFDLIKLKNQLSIDASELRSAGLAALARSCKELRHRVPTVVGAEADPDGGPRVQEAAMRLYQKRGGAGGGAERVHLLQGFQAVEAAVKRFFFGYKEMVAVVIGSLEASGNHRPEPSTAAEIFGEPTYFPSLDAAKTFLGSQV